MPPTDTFLPPEFNIERLIILDRRIRRLNNLMNGRQEGTNKYHEYKRTLKKKTHERHLLIWKYLISLVKWCQLNNIQLTMEDLTKHNLIDHRNKLLVKTMVDNLPLTDVIIKQLQDGKLK